MSVPGLRHGLSLSGRSSSMLTCVMGLPTAGYMGLLSMSMFDLEAARAVESALGAPTWEALGLDSFSVVAASLAVERCGIFLMSLYFDVLESR